MHPGSKQLRFDDFAFVLIVAIGIDGIDLASCPRECDLEGSRQDPVPLLTKRIGSLLPHPPNPTPPLLKSTRIPHPSSTPRIGPWPITIDV
jgi:hypothetical protein